MSIRLKSRVVLVLHVIPNAAFIKGRRAMVRLHFRQGLVPDFHFRQYQVPKLTIAESCEAEIPKL